MVDEFSPPRGKETGAKNTYSKGQTRKRPVSADAITRSNPTENTMSGPIVGVIINKYFSNDPNNISNALRNQMPATRETYDVKGAGYLERSAAKTNTKGSQLEVDIKIIKGVSGFAESGTILTQVPVCLSLGGVKNYGFVVPQGTTNGNFPGYTGKENGDYCLVQFIGGVITGAIVTNIMPHPLNTEDCPAMHDDNTMFARINGTSFWMDPNGNFQLDARHAGELRTTNPDSGNTSVKQGIGSAGKIEVVTRNDITLSAGFSKDNKGYTLPAGSVTLVGSKNVVLRSNSQEVYINSKADGTLVKVQNLRGSLRPAARKYDKIKITSGNSGDLFEYLDQLHQLIECVGNQLESYSTDAGAKAAGSQMVAFIATYPKPTWQTGKIITGSAYCQIAGVGTADDIGGDESGIRNAQGEQISEDALLSMALGEVAPAVDKIVDDKESPSSAATEGDTTAKLSETAKSLKQSSWTYLLGKNLQDVIPTLAMALTMLKSGDIGSLPDTSDGTSFDGTFGKVDENEFLPDGVTKNPDYGKRAGGKQQTVDMYSTVRDLMESMLGYAELINLAEERQANIAAGGPPDGDTEGGIYEVANPPSIPYDVYWTPSLSEQILTDTYGDLSVFTDFMPKNPTNPNLPYTTSIYVEKEYTTSANPPTETFIGDYYTPTQTAYIAAKAKAEKEEKSLAKEAKKFNSDWLDSSGAVPGAEGEAVAAASAGAGILMQLASVILNPTAAAVQAIIAELSKLGGDGGSGKEEVVKNIDKKLP